MKMKSSPTLLNHFNYPLLTSNNLPPVNSLLHNLEIHIFNKSPSPYPLPPQISHHNDTLDIFTDASLNLKSSTGSCAIYSPTINFKLTFPPHLPASSTHLELQAIRHALLIFLSTKTINLYSDSLSAIKSILNPHPKPYSQLLKSSSFPTFNHIHNILNLQKQNNHHTNFLHVYSHLLDTKPPPNHQKKLIIMKQTFKSNTESILTNNKICDNLTTNIKFNLSPIPPNHPGLPQTFYSYQNTPYFAVSIPIKLSLTNIHKNYLKLHCPKRLDWFFSDNCEKYTTTNSEHIAFQNILPKLSQSLMFTKERAFHFYQKDSLSLSPHTLHK